jgi:ribose transport system ATP-binding protein
MSGAVRLAARGIRKTFAATRAVDDVDLDLHAGEMLALVGANGAGKSTLIKIICGAVPADAGSLAIDGRPVHPRNVADAHAAGIAVAHQQIAIIPCLNGAENIMLGREPLRGGLIDTRALRATAQTLADRFGVAIDLARECGELTLGENKILDILKAIAHEPAVLILDEPTASLSLAETRRLFAFLDDLKRRGLAILFISHHLNEVFEHCDRVAVMKDGAKVFDGPVRDASPAEVVRLMVGRAIVGATWTSQARPDAVALRLSETRIERLHIPELTVRRGEIVGIAGVLGAGQTELLERLAGMPHETHGASAQVGPLARLPNSVGQAIDAGIYLVADDRVRKTLFPGLDVGENLATGALAQISRGIFMRPRIEAQEIDRVVARLGVKCSGPRQPVMELSGGNQQKVAFGRWLVRMARGARSEPPILLLDNPTEGVDVGAKAEIYELIRAFTRQGAAVLIASAEFAELIALSDRVYCISHHRLATCLPRADLTEERLLLEVA